MIKAKTTFNPAALSPEYMSNFAKESQPAPASKNHFLYPGQLLVVRPGEKISTILGSCAAICLWDRRRKIGGMNHYLLPEGPENSPSPYRYGNHANAALLHQLLSAGCQLRDLEGKIFGGSSTLSADPTKSLGAQNVRLAEQFLQSSRIPLVLTDVSGKWGRRLTFNTEDGTTLIKVFDKC